MGKLKKINSGLSSSGISPVGKSGGRLVKIGEATAKTHIKTEKRSTPAGGSAVGQNKYIEMLDRNNADAQANSMRQPTRAEYNEQKLKKQAADQAKWRTKYSGYSFKELEKALDDISDINEKQWVEDYMMSDESGSTGLQRLYHNLKKVDMHTIDK